jgi:hypothetical protein
MSNITVGTANMIEFDGRKFYEGQRVSIGIERCSWRSYDGVITDIRQGYLELDCSTRHNSNFKTIYFKEITRISYLR